MDVGSKLDVGDINMNMDMFFVVRGDVEILMREDQIHRARKNGSEISDEGSL